MKHLFLTLLFLAFSSSAYAKQEFWMSFMIDQDGKGAKKAYKIDCSKPQPKKIQAWLVNSDKLLNQLKPDDRVTLNIWGMNPNATISYAKKDLIKYQQKVGGKVNVIPYAVLDQKGNSEFPRFRWGNFCSKAGNDGKDDLTVRMQVKVEKFQGVSQITGKPLYGPIDNVWETRSSKEMIVRTSASISQSPNQNTKKGLLDAIKAGNAAAKRK